MNLSTSTSIDAFTTHVAVALFNGVFQGLLILLILWLGFKIFHRINAATRHAVSFAALLLVSALPLLHLIHPSSTSIASSPPLSALPVVDAPTPAPTPQGLVTVASAPIDQSADNSFTATKSHATSEPTTDTASARSSDPYVNTSASAPQQLGPSIEPNEPIKLEVDTLPTPYPQLNLELAVAVPSNNDSASVPSPAGTPSAPDALQTNATAATASKLAGSKIPLPSVARVDFPIFKAGNDLSLAILQGLLILLALISAIRLTRLAAQAAALSGLKRSSQVVNADVLNLFNHLCTETRMRRPVRLLISDQLSTPIALGYSKPVILLPSQLVPSMSVNALEAILRHELAHISRHDDWTNLVQQFATALLSFHPAVRWLDRRLTMDREIACDDHALAAGSIPGEYALLLTNFVRQTQRDSDWIAAPAGWNGNSQLKERIDMILDTKRNSAPQLASARAGILSFTLATTTALVLLTAPRLVLAGTDDDATPPPPPPPPANAARQPEPYGSQIPTSALPALPAPHAPGSLQATTPVHPPVPPSPSIPPQVTRRYFGGPEGSHPADPNARPPLPPQPMNHALEARLDRLEAMVRSLVESRGHQDVRLHTPPHPQNPFQNAPHPGSPNRPDREMRRDTDIDMEREIEIEIEERHGQRPHPVSRAFRDIEMHLPDKQDIDNAMRAAEQQAQKALEFLHRSTGDLGRQLSERQRERESIGEPRENQLKRQLLHEHRGSIERQKRALERQMQRLDREMQRLGEQLEELNAEMEQMEEMEQVERLQHLERDLDQIQSEDLPHKQF